MSLAVRGFRLCLFAVASLTAGIASAQAPTAEFSGAPRTGVAPLTVNFTDFTSGSATSYSWSFGDGGSSTLQDPTHAYTTAGTYTVSLTATGPGGSDTETKPAYITVLAPPPSADFNGTPTTGAVPLTVSFSDASTGAVSGFLWSFGDKGTSTLANPVHTYTATGTYTVSLTVTGPGGVDTNIKTDYITVTDEAPVAEFSSTPMTGLAPLNVQFTSLATGVVSAQSWTFGDGGTSSAQSPAHTYSSPGTYTVSLSVVGPGGGDVETKPGFITVLEPPPVANFDGTPRSGTAPLNVTFSDLSTGAVTSWAWTFGDGGTSSQQNPTHSYASAGTYTVALTATGPGGSDAEVRAGFIVASIAAPVAGFAGTPLTGVAPLSVTFTDQSTGVVTGRSWTFGDGTAARVTNPVKVFSDPGVYTVSLTAAGPGGLDTETKTSYVTVLEPPPVAEFAAVPVAGVAPLVVSFTDFSEGNVTNYSWDFGDGSGSAVANPTHTYTSAGNYTVTLTVVSSGGIDTETKVSLITVSEPAPVANFNAAPTSGTGSLTVNFNNTSTGAITSHAWDFGDQGTSTAVSPSHFYSAPGTYTVTLTVTGPGGIDTTVATDLVTIAVPAPTASFSASPTSGVHPLTVTFTDLSSGDITSRAWAFGDGGTSTLQNPVHTYTAAGTYTVALTTNGPGGTDVDTQVGLIVVSEPAPVAEFVGTPTSGVAPHTVSFTDLSTGPVTTYAWTFGDGGTSSLASPSHLYTTPGSYTVSLTTTGPGGSDSEVKIDYVIIDPPAPVASFTGTPLTGVAPLTVSFNDTSGNSVSGWSWAFGDGGTSTLENPTHTYTDPGVYTVALTAVGPGGSDTVTNVGFITVNEPSPVARFFGVPRSGTAPLTVFFTDVSTGSVSTYSWDFGDSTSSTLSDPSHTYTNPGNYTVSLTVTSPGGSDTETKLSYITVGEPAPFAEFSASPTTGTNPLTVNFTNLSTGSINTHTWDFGDLSTSSAVHPSHTYADPGIYSVNLTVTGPGGVDSETKIDLIVVGNPAPSADFFATPTSGVQPLTVAFTDTTAGVVTSYAWTFGDGGTSALQNPVHTYSSAGTYTVSLTATGPGGADTETKTDYITVNTPPPVADFSGAPSSGVRPLTVSFTDATTGIVTSWSWAFGDGGTSTQQNPSHTYVSAGTYTVALTSTGPGGSDSETKIGYIVVTELPPVAEFSATPTLGVAPLTVSFTDLTSGVASTYFWAFGDGLTSTQESPTHVYTAAGTYTVSLTSTGPGGSSTETKTDFITVLEPAPVAEFAAAPTSGAAPLTVGFTNQSVGNVTSFSWSFGDGGTSTLENPSHVYTAPGSYTVSLTVTSAGGANTETKPDLVSVTLPLLDGSFEGQTAGTLPAAPWTVTSGAAHVIQPDGVPTDNAFPSNGSLWVDISGDGTNSATPPSNPGGVGSLPSGAAGISQSFTFDPVNPVLYFEAAFLLGGPAMSAGANDFMSVDISDGSTNANLYYRDTFSSFPLTSARYGLPMTLRSLVQRNLRSVFPAADASTILTLRIQVGNGGNALNPSRGYVDNCLLGAEATVAFRNGLGVNPAVFVAPPPVVGTTWTSTIDPTPLPGAALTLILAFAAPSGGAVIPGLGEVLFDGASSSFFAVAGVPLGTQNVPVPLNLSFVGVSSAVQGIIGAGATFVLTNAADVVVGLETGDVPPSAGFNASPTSGAAPLTVTFINQSTGNITGHEWSFGDGATSTAANPVHTYTSPGTYTVTLVVSGPGGFDIHNAFDLIVVP